MYRSFIISCVLALMLGLCHDTVGDGPVQPYPSTPKAPGTFWRRQNQTFSDVIRAGPWGPRSSPISPLYLRRESADIPFGRLFYGNLSLYPHGQTKTSTTVQWGSKYDWANQSACGIPDNAFYKSKVGIHPYFLKYAGLPRYCMQDVCISFWRGNHPASSHNDMVRLLGIAQQELADLKKQMLKVTDICTSDSSDGVPCEDPMNIKVDRAKVAQLYNVPVASVKGNRFNQPVWWWFMKCRDDGMADVAYVNNSNWFTEPYLGNNWNFAMGQVTAQLNANRKYYPAKGFPVYPTPEYPHRMYDQAYMDSGNYTVQPLDDWVKGQEPGWEPIAGGART